MALSFADLKAEVLNRAKRLELCESYQQALVAQDYASLIQSSVSLIEWTYQSGVVDDALLADFPEADLNAAGIYISDATITDPQQYIYLISGSFTVNVTGNNQCRLRVMSNVVVTINLSDNAYLDLKLYETAHATLNANDASSVTFEAINGAVLDLYPNNTSASNGKISDDAILNITAVDSSYTFAKAFNNSTVSYTIAGSAEVEVKTYNRATITGL